MTSAVTYGSPIEDTPLARVRLYAELFRIHFRDFFPPPPKRYIARALHKKASAFMRGLEALVRRLLAIEAAAIVPTLPPAKPPGPEKTPESATSPQPAGPPQSSGPAEAPATLRPPCFKAFRPPLVRAHAAAAARPAAGPPPALTDLRPLARRYDAIMHALETHTARARRLAFRLRGRCTADGAPQIVESPRPHPDHARYLEHDLDVLRDEANAALRAMLRATPLPAAAAVSPRPTPADLCRNQEKNDPESRSFPGRVRMRSRGGT